MKKRDIHAIVMTIVVVLSLVVGGAPATTAVFAKKTLSSSSKKTIKKATKKNTKKSTKKKTTKKKIKKAERLTIDPPLIDPDNPPGGASAY